MNKYDQLRAAIAGVDGVNRRLLGILPARRMKTAAAQERLARKVMEFFRERGPEAERKVGAFMNALGAFSYEEFPRGWREVWRMTFLCRRVMWRLHRVHFPDNELLHQVFHEEEDFFRAISKAGRGEGSRMYWERLWEREEYSRRALHDLKGKVVKSFEMETPQAVCISAFGIDALKQLVEAERGTRGSVARTRRRGTDGEGRRGPQTAFMAKQRKAFLEYLKVHPETASVSRITRARECWAIHRKEWDAAAKKGVGYADYKALSRAKLM